jgi:hypothetical protein
MAAFGECAGHRRLRTLCRFGAVFALFMAEPRRVSGALCDQRATPAKLGQRYLARSLGCDADHSLGMMGVQPRNRLAGCHPARGAKDKKGGERQMNYLTQVTNRPMLRITAEIVLAFCCAAPLVLVVTSFVAYGLHSLTH